MTVTANVIITDKSEDVMIKYVSAFLTFALLSAVLYGSEQVFEFDGVTDYTFVKQDWADYTLEVNQDRITDNTWITRGDYAGIYNYFSEDHYQKFGSSPVNTRWAFEGLNGNSYGTVYASNWQNLAFDTWENAHESGAAYIVGLAAVMHIIDLDYYIDIKFTGWSYGTPPNGVTGGGFSYIRAAIDTGEWQCSEFPGMDANQDCIVDLSDFIYLKSPYNRKKIDMTEIYNFASQWLMCNRVPQSSCLE
jgi:hypothetical protein